MKTMANASRTEPVARIEANGERHYYNISQAAELLGVSRVSIWRWIRAGRLPVARLGHRTVRIRREDLDRILGQLGPAGSRAWMARSSDEHTVAGGCPTSAAVVDSDRRAVGSRGHFVQFYEADAFLLDAVAEFAGTALRAGDSAVVVATPPHRDGVAERLRAYGPDVADACARGSYLPLDAAQTLARFMVDGAPDWQRFREVLGAVLAQATAGGRGVRVFGEMVALLALEGNHAGAVRLEQLWNDLGKTHEFALFCAYPMNR